jgi:hypothetical protein
MRGQSSPPAPPGSALRTRLRISAAVGLAILGARLYYTVNAVLGLYDATLSIERSTGLRQGVIGTESPFRDADEALARHVSISGFANPAEGTS